MPGFSLRLRAWDQWRAAAGPWCTYGVCPALVVPDAADAPAPAPRRARIETTPNLTVIFGDQPTAVVVDLAPDIGVRLAASASQLDLAFVVLVLPRWPHAAGVLGCDTLVQALLDGSRRLGKRPRPNVMFVLDAERERSIQRSPSDSRVDNRYTLAAGDLPPLAVLRAAGIQRIVRIACAA